MPSRKPDPTSVFLNVPFDQSYEPVFLGLLASLVSLGLKPRSVIEIVDFGQGRIERIIDLMLSCKFSIHELGRVGTPVRFNMPFELGIACALSRYRKPHCFTMLEAESHRLDKTLSDMKGIDPKIHFRTVGGAIECMLATFRKKSGGPSPDNIRGLYKDLAKYSMSLKKQYRKKKIFTRSVFTDLVKAAVLMAKKRNMIR